MTLLELEHRNRNGFDLVHDATRVYRALLEAISRPGTIADIGETAARCGLPSSEENVVLAIAYTLLDPEVKYYVRRDRHSALQAAIASGTFCKRSDPDEADYLFALGQEEGEELVARFPVLKKGSLEQPERSAALFLQAEAIVTGDPSQADWVLSGPGVAKPLGLSVKGAAPSFLEERNRANAEYPIGIDLFWFTSAGKLAALPRTTIVKEAKREWDT